eukprot:scaffold4437_cov391-Prasinococcus_capsulatus_cf.AAC.12
MQEFNAAKEAVLQAIPDATIKANRMDAYPIKVTVKRNGQAVWSGPQRNLFRKNFNLRAESQEAIKKALEQ